MDIGCIGDDRSWIWDWNELANNRYPKKNFLHELIFLFSFFFSLSFATSLPLSLQPSVVPFLHTILPGNLATWGNRRSIQLY